MEGRKVSVSLVEPRVAKGNEVLVCEGVGSGIVLCLFDAKKQIGAMTHVLLPGEPQEGSGFRYGATAVKALLDLLEPSGVEADSVSAVLVGGSHPFGPSEFDLSNATADCLRANLTALGIQVLLDETGGSSNRAVEVSVSRSQIEVHSLAKPLATLCEVRAA